jgi:hypothetical protein
MLALAFLSWTLFPHHYHLHHADGSAPQGSGIQAHAASVHVHAHAASDDIAHHEDAHIIKAVADAPLKFQGSKLGWVAILLTFLLLLPLFTQVGRTHPLALAQPLPRFNRHAIPPLRAPPRN